jgi:SAM-dependent methyltransferase
MQSYLPRAKTHGALMLDVGCGAAHFRPVFEHCGFKYVGVDIAGDYATILADARALPFPEDTFEFVWSNRVLQYVPHPDVALEEICRVMLPGARFMGSLGFIEVFDGANFHLTTTLGAHQYFRDAGFEVDHVTPDDVWTGPIALGSALFPHLPRPAINLVAATADWLSRQHWRIGTLLNRNMSEGDRLLKIAGVFEFILRKAHR